ncbi:MAG: hypothetical protein Q8909_18550, partial [Bacteroidota bacterium]|nr:hypothetical protein [Bacteroidota bacterium]
RMPVFDQLTVADSLLGTWKGKLYTYDWSRVNVELEENMTLQMQTANSLIMGKWYVNGKFVSGFMAEPAGKYWKIKSESGPDSILRFVAMKVFTCQIQHHNDSTCLFGNFVRAEKQENEPLRPTCFVLNKENNPRVDTTFVINRVYPNPYKSQIKVDFTVIKNDRITFRLHDTSGHCYYVYPTREYEPGKHTIMLSPPALPSGSYNIGATGIRFTLYRNIIKQ